MLKATVILQYLWHSDVPTLNAINPETLLAFALLRLLYILVAGEHSVINLSTPGHFKIFPLQKPLWEMHR